MSYLMLLILKNYLKKQYNGQFKEVQLIEHYSQYTFNLANVPDDKLDNDYEYPIKEFADISSLTATEFYTNHTVVKLITMDPQLGESV